MAKGIDTRIIEAKKMYETGMKLVDIATELDVPAGTVRRWKSTNKWDGEQKNERPERSEKPKKKERTKQKKPEEIPKEIKTLEDSDLTDRQKMFCIYYAKTFNATQSYLRAYGCTKETAYVNSSKLLSQAKIQAEVRKLREAKLNQIALAESDMIEYHMRIAFADMGEYLTFGQEEIAITKNGVPLEIEDPETGEKTPVTRIISTVQLNDSVNVDTQLIQEIREGREGISIKLIDKNKSLDWLSRFFLMNPMDKHKIEFDNKKFELEKSKASSDDEEDNNLNIKVVRASKE